MNLYEQKERLRIVNSRLKAAKKMVYLYSRLTTHNYDEIEEELQRDSVDSELSGKIEQTSAGRFYHDLTLFSEYTYFAFAKGPILKGRPAPILMGNKNFHVFGQKPLTTTEISKHFIDPNAKDLFLTVAPLIMERPAVEKARLTISEFSRFVLDLKQGKHSLLRELPPSKPNKREDNSARRPQHLTLTTSSQVGSSGHVVPREINGKE